MLKQDIQKLLKEKGIWPKKGLGQNFLISQKILEKIVIASLLKPQDIVLEIGPGLGILTKELASRVKKVIAIEKDAKLAGILQEILIKSGIKNVEVVQGDILTKSKIQIPKNYKIVSNLPYNIATAIIRMFLQVQNPPKSMVLMLQKEVGERICAKKPNKMSYLAIFCQFYAKPKIIASVVNKCFWPCPKVDSVILSISQIQENMPKLDKDRFFKIVRAGFSHPRKQLAKNFKNNLNISSKQAENWLLKNNIKPIQRAETLELSNWIKLAKSCI